MCRALSQALSRGLQVISPQHWEAETTGAIFQKGKLRHRKVKSLAQGPSARIWQNPDLFDSRALFSLRLKAVPHSSSVRPPP